MDDPDAEVSAVFGGRSIVPPLVVQASGANQGTPKYTIIDMDRSDDEESDHTPDPYSQHMKGRVSPSPYTANTERARQFNAYVRGVIEQKLDVLVPISHQPRELITDIIADASTKFPEFSSCVRKRIRTFLKSYRRSKKIKEVAVSPAQNGVNSGGSKVEEGTVNTFHPTVVAPPLPQQNSTEVHQQPPACTAVVTIPPMREDLLPDAKRVKLSPTPRPLVPSTSQVLNLSEVTAVRQLITGEKPSTRSLGDWWGGSLGGLTSKPQEGGGPLVFIQALVLVWLQSRVVFLPTGYRESAAFLQRAADQLEAMLAKDSTSSV